MRAIFGVAVCMLWVLFVGAASAQPRAAAQGNELPERDLLNAGTVTVITAPIGGPMSIMGSDMSSVLDDEDKLRVLPILGKGSVQNLIDILRLKNIDMGFVTTDALEFAKAEYNIPDIPKRVRYITRLFHNDIHIVARKEIRSLQDLQGKRIFAERSIGLPAARLIFRRMGIEVDIDSQTDPDGGLQKLLNGERDAWVASVSRGAPVIKNIKNDAGKFHLLEIPYAKPLQDIYLPSSFSSEEYPNLVAKDMKVYALAVPTVLMVYNWPPESERYRRVARFVDALFGKIGQLQQPPRHPKWKDTGISINVVGLERFKPAQDWLDKAQPAAAAQPGPTAATAEEFRAFLDHKNASGSLSQQETSKAYNDFIRWRAGQK